MALNIKNKNVEQLVQEMVSVTGESKTEAIRKALSERMQRLSLRYIQQPREARLLEFLEEEVWPFVPADVLGTTTSKAEVEAILGYGELGV